MLYYYYNYYYLQEVDGSELKSYTEAIQEIYDIDKDGRITRKELGMLLAKSAWIYATGMPLAKSAWIYATNMLLANKSAKSYGIGMLLANNSAKSHKKKYHKITTYLPHFTLWYFVEFNGVPNPTKYHKLPQKYIFFG